MNIIKSKIKYSTYGHHNPHTITLHHTAGGRVGSEAYLKQQGLGYHYMIDVDATVYSYNEVNAIVGHSSRANNGYVGISYVSGGPLGPTSEKQIQASIELMNMLKGKYSSITKVSTHAAIDKLVAKRGWKSDPHYIGEKTEQNNWLIKNRELDKVEAATGLKAIKYLPILNMMPILNDTYPQSVDSDDIDIGCC
jgi:hypothetical protein